jgi:hypothetical protein
LSFFDDADEPQTARRPASRRRSPSGGGRRPPSDRQAIQTRRAVAAVAGLIIIILLILGIHSCQVSARNSALKDYNNNVASLIQQSVASNGRQLFQELSSPSSSGAGAGTGSNLQQQISLIAASAARLLGRAAALSVPSEAKQAQGNLLLTFQMRHDALVNIAREIQPALSSTASKDAVNTIASEMGRLYASDAVYKDYVIPEIRSALNSALGDPGTQNLGQFVPTISWLGPNNVATALGATIPNPAVTHCVSGKLYGHLLDSVSVAGTALQTGSTNNLPASPAPKFTLNYTNGGDVNEPNVKFEVSVSGTGDSGQTTVPSTTAHASGTADVTLHTPPSTGTYTVVAKIVGVHCEKTTANNSLSFPVTFQ